MTEPDDSIEGVELDRHVLELRESGASWLEIQQQLGLTRQQARYAYQKAKRQVRRSERHSSARDEQISS